MKKLAALGVAIAMFSAPVLADTTTMSALPGQSMTVTNWYNQNVYDAADNKIGEVKDVLVSQDSPQALLSRSGWLTIGEMNEWFCTLDTHGF